MAQQTAKHTHVERVRRRKKIGKCWHAIDEDAAGREAEDAATACAGLLCLRVHERDKEQLGSHKRGHDSVLRAA